jgi:hypothetical protein
MENKNENFILTVIFFFFTYYNLFSQIDPLWTAYYNDEYDGNSDVMSIALDNQNNVYVTGMSDHAYQFTPIQTVKYYSNGERHWVRMYPNEGHPNYDDESQGYSIATYFDGENTYIYVTGRIFTTNHGSDFVTLKYKDDGEFEWANTYDGPGHGNDNALKIAIDANGNAYVTGVSTGNGTNQDYATIKYRASDGYELWSSRYNCSTNGNDFASSIKIGSNGTVFVTGTSDSTGTGNDIVTIAYDPDDGSRLWLARYDRNNTTENGNDLAVYIGQGVYVAGISGDYITVLRYNTLGGLTWVNYAQSGTSNAIEIYRRNIGEGPNSYTIDIFVTGSSDEGYGKTIRYDNSGNVVNGWPNTFDYYSNLMSIAVDQSENVFVTGSVFLDAESLCKDYLTIKYNKDGSQIWYASFDGDNDDYSIDVAVDSYGNSYVTGNSYPYSCSSPGDASYVTLKYSSSCGDSFGPES